MNYCTVNCAIRVKLRLKTKKEKERIPQVTCVKRTGWGIAREEDILCCTFRYLSVSHMNVLSNQQITEESIFLSRAV